MRWRNLVTCPSIRASKELFSTGSLVDEEPAMKKAMSGEVSFTPGVFATITPLGCLE